MKCFQYIVICLFLLAYCPFSNAQKKHSLTVGTFIPPLSTIVGMYEYNIPIGKQKLGIGAMYLYRNPQGVDAKEWSVTPRINYFLVNKKAGDIYIGTGVARGSLRAVDQWDFRLQAGLNVNFMKHLAFKLEYGNYMFNDNGGGMLGGLQISL